MGVVDSLSAGYRFVIQRLELLLLPLLLDLMIWAAPRLSVEPLLAQIALFYQDFSGDAEETSAQIGEITTQFSDALLSAGSSSNLFGFLVNGTLFHVPSLLTSIPSIKANQGAIEIGSILSAGGLVLLIGGAGLFIGVLYMNHLALALPIGASEKTDDLRSVLSRALRHWRRTITFLVGLVIGLLFLYVPASIGTGLLLLLSPILGSIAMFLLSGLSVVIFFYLYFVTAGLVLDNLTVWQAVRRSVMLVRNNFWVTLSFVVMTILISLGIGLILTQIAVGSQLGLVFAAPLNAFVNTGLAMALLVFYRTRLLMNKT